MKATPRLPAERARTEQTPAFFMSTPAEVTRQTALVTAVSLAPALLGTPAHFRTLAVFTVRPTDVVPSTATTGAVAAETAPTPTALLACTVNV